MSLTSSVPMFVVSVKAVLVVLRAVMEAVWLLSSAAWTPVSRVVAIMSSKLEAKAALGRVQAAENDVLAEYFPLAAYSRGRALGSLLHVTST